MGILTLTINNHGFQPGDKVKLAASTATFNQGALPAASYQNKWINLFNVTTNTFDVYIGTGAGGTWTFSSAGSNSVTYATSVVRIAPESLQLSCTHAVSYTHLTLPTSG